MTLRHEVPVSLPHVVAPVTVEYWHGLLEGLYQVVVYRTGLDSACLMVCEERGRKVVSTRCGYNYMLPLGQCPVDRETWMRDALVLLSRWRAAGKKSIIAAWPSRLPAATSG